MTSSLDTTLSARPATPWWFWLIGALALIWNLMGVGAYIMQVTSTPEALVEAYGQTQADMIAAQPGWYTGVFALAVFSGALGGLALLLRKPVAVLLFALSLLCVIIQNVYFATANVFAHVHGGQWVMVIMIPVIALFLFWFSRNMRAKGLLR